MWILDVRKHVLDFCKQLNNAILSWPTTCLTPSIAPELMSAVETRNHHRLNGQTDHSQAMTENWELANLPLMYISQTMGRLSWLADILPLYVVSVEVSWVKWAKNTIEEVLRWTETQFSIPDIFFTKWRTFDWFCGLYWQFFYSGQWTVASE